MTEIQKQKIQWLSRARTAQQKLNALYAVQKQEQHLLEETALFEDNPELSLHLESLIRQTQNQLQQLLLLREEIRTVILSLPDPQLQAILFRRYLAYETHEKIAEAMFYDIRTIQRKHKQALDSIALPTENRISETTIFPNISCNN